MKNRQMKGSSVNKELPSKISQDKCYPSELASLDQGSTAIVIHLPNDLRQIKTKLILSRSIYRIVYLHSIK